MQGPNVATSNHTSNSTNNRSTFNKTSLELPSSFTDENLKLLQDSPQEHEKSKIPKPETRNKILNAIKITKDMQSGGGFLTEATKDTFKEFFGEEPPPVKTCDPYEIYRARMTEIILRLSQGSRGSYVVYDPTSNYYNQIMDKPPLIDKLPYVTSEVLFTEDPFANTDRVSPQPGSESCETTTSDSPVMSKVMDFLMNAPFMPKKVSEAYKKAMKAGDSKYGKETLKLIGRGIQVANSKAVEPPSMQEINDLVSNNLKRLNGLTRDKFVEQERKIF